VTFEVDASPRFVRKAAKLLRRHPDLRSNLATAIDGLRDDPFQPSLRIHPLHGDLSGFHAVSVTYQFRIVLVLQDEERRITLMNIGSHDEVYGKAD
jgi:mRNA interferase YafQ